MTTARLLPILLALPLALHAEPEELSGSEAFLAASLAAFSTPSMKDAPIQIHGAITQASGVQEDYGATAIVAIPDGAAAKLDLAHLPADGSALPLCRLWVKGFTLNQAQATPGAAAGTLEIKARGAKHSVTLWLLGVRRSAHGTPEVIVCANQKQPVLVLPAAPLHPLPARHDVPVKVSVTGGGELCLGLLGTHEVRMEMGRGKSQK